MSASGVDMDDGKSLTSSRGLVNGGVAKTPNGLVNGNASRSSRGLVNGSASSARGLVNGTAPPRPHGPTDGGGRVNGLRSANGLTNGVPRPRLSRNVFGVVSQKDLRIGISLLVLAFLLLGPVYYYLSSPDGAIRPAIVMDGDFDDWTAVPKYSGATVTANPHINLRQYAVLLEGNTLYLYATVAGIMFGDVSGYDSMYVFVDQDGDAATGYAALGLGAEYLVEVSGGNGTVARANLWEFGGSDSMDWGGWMQISVVRATSAVSAMEAAVPLGNTDIGTASGLRFTFHDHEGGESDAVAAVGTEYGALLVRREAVEHVIGVGPAEPLLRLTMKAIGADVTVDQLTLSVSDNLPLAAGPETPLTLKAGVPYVTDVRVDTSSLAPGDIVFADIAFVDTDRPTTVEGVAARAYVGVLPTGMVVDGIFLDWATNVTADPAGDVARESVDISGTALETDVTSAFFYVRTSGLLLSGDPVPVKRAPPRPSTGGATGPIVVAPSPTGEDFLNVYVDTNSSDLTGLTIGGLMADRLLKIRGYGGRIISTQLLEWRDGWVASGGGVDAMKDDHQIEVGVQLTALGPLTQSRVLFVMSDWRGLMDTAEGDLGTRSSEGTRSQGVPTPTATAPPSDPTWTSLGTDFGGESFNDESLNITEMFFADSSEYLYVRLEMNSAVALGNNTSWIYLDLTGDGNNDWLIAEKTEWSSNGVCSYEWDASNTNWGIADSGCDVSDTLSWADTGSGIKVTAGCSGSNDCIDFALEKSDYPGLLYNASVTGATDDNDNITFNPSGEGSDESVRDPSDAAGGSNCDTPASKMGGDFDCQAPVSIPEFEALALPMAVAVLIPVAIARRRSR